MTNKTLILNRRGEPVMSLQSTRFPNLLRGVDLSEKDSFSAWPLECYMSGDLDLFDIQQILRAEGLVVDDRLKSYRQYGNFHPSKKAQAEGWIDPDRCWSSSLMPVLLKKYALTIEIKKAVIEWIGSASIERFLSLNTASEIPLPSISEARENLQCKTEALYAAVIGGSTSLGWLVPIEMTMQRINSFIEWKSLTCTGSSLSVIKNPHLKKEIKPREPVFLKPYFKRNEFVSPASSRSAVDSRLPWQIGTIVAIANKCSTDTIPHQAVDFYLEDLPASTLAPMFRWAGGKSHQVRLIHVILRMFQGRVTRLVDPFCGAASIPFGVGFKNAVLNDVNPSLINYYQIIQRGLSISPSMLTLPGYPRGVGDIDKPLYFKVRDNILNVMIARHYEYRQLGLELSDVEKQTWAAAFHVITKTSFNGLWRERKSGQMNTPSCIADGDNVCIRWLDMSQYKDFFSSCKITCGDYKDVETGGEESLLYIDSPYAGTFANYNRGGFTIDNHQELIEWASCHKGPVIMNNSNWESLGPLYTKHGFLTTPYLSTTSISGKAKGRREVDELLAIKNMEF
jgi:DNA adenine methylase